MTAESKRARERERASEQASLNGDDWWTSQFKKSEEQQQEIEDQDQNLTGH